MTGSAIASGNEKGGGCKTTVIATLAGTLADRGYSVGLLDADPKARISNWIDIGDWRSQIDVRREVAPDFVRKAIVDLQKMHEIVFIDTAGAESATNRVVTAMADFVLLTTGSSAADFPGLIEFRDLIASVSEKANRDIPFAALVCKTSISTKTRKSTTKAGRNTFFKLVQHEIPFFDHTWPAATAFETMFESGDYPKKGSPHLAVQKTIRALIEAGYIPAHPRTN